MGRNRIKLLYKGLLGIGLSLLTPILYAGIPLWTFQALTPTTITVAANSNAIVQYQITNQSPKTHTLVMQPIAGVTQITSGNGICGNPFTLPGKRSCILSLQINGSQLTHPIIDGPIVCQNGSNQCYRPAPADILRVSQASAISDAMISATGSPLTLAVNGGTGQLTITNLSLDVAATNIASNFTGTALDGNVSETGNTCASVAPGASCTLTYTAGNTVVPQTNFTIQGTNTNAITAAIEIDQAMISVTGSPLTLLTNGVSGQLTINNLSTDITATGITSNFTGTALDGNVTETGNTCASVAPSSSCTLTYTPGNTVVAQTNFTIQGSNTNAITAAIQIDPGSTLTLVNPNTGTIDGGTPVTLTGTGLTGATAVTFDGVAATSVIVVNSTTVTAVTPAHAAGLVDVGISTPAGGATLTNGYTYLTIVIGQSLQGGKVACLGGAPYLNLIAATADNSTGIGIAWGPLTAPANTITTGATSLLDGSTNTTVIVTCLTNGSGNISCAGSNISAPLYAAGLCSTYEIDSAGNTPCQMGNTCYDDWFLAARDQLSCLYTNNVAVGGFTPSFYWASSEQTTTTARVVNFNDGTLGNGIKSGPTRVRCVRSFTP